MAKGRGGADDAIAEGRAEVVSRIAEAMERDGLAWAAEWRGCWSPTNPTTGRAYRGLNRVSLAAAMHHGGFEDPRWCTFNQLRDAGWHVERGTKAAGSVEFWSWYVPTKRFGGTRVVTLQRAEQLVRDGRLPEEALGGAFLSGRLHHVFNGSQIEGIGPFDASVHAPAAPEVERIADEFIASSRCPVAEVAGDRAFYRPSEDRIYLPRRAQFTTMDGFARTALHEMCHSTAREVGREVEQGREGYAREELVAELGSVFAAADAGLDMGAFANADMGQTFLENHAAYLRSWLGAIRDDPAALARAATSASKAAGYVTGRREGLLEERTRAIALDARQAVPTDVRSLSERAGTARAAGGLVHAGPCRAMGEPGRLEP
jgi:antirestriction protein ArdC